ncbi:membrane-bound PQQ-dependent dehydrogenase, glucose/quinate/shikimate family [Pseudomonas sp. sia0905]|uniref:membrane-bound PQQ-dependent dehydrogenase, glucose/quinate/shikimate family n=1 Tax=Pseudomonas sp. sia0905 TaxID=2854783 RepID=UPI001C488098|nr:membrane-bound PQQ-dependent dehydrogenase, glucose/quinate/shikimate family [Pseudomonas sp. sia0905]MBV7562559.1 membrane-bound PQQ-dependent dehydrogenase, glucose/quinate/shikimate family [Pseudomonas sp. sia0905]
MANDRSPPSAIARLWLAALGLVILATGLFFSVNGYRLIALGGSAYFLIAGVLMLAAGVQIVRARSSGGVLFTLVFVGSLAWSLWDAGLDFWPLISRLMVLTGFMICVALSYPLLQRGSGRSATPAPAFVAAGVLLLGFGAAVWGMFQPHPVVAASGKAPAATPASEAQQNWEHYGNTPGGSRFVALDQITPDNVKNLQVAWSYRTGDVPESPTGNGAEDQQTPLQVGDRVFLCTPHNNVIALEAATGKEIWNRQINAQQKKWMRCRGLAYFDATRPIAQPTQPNSTPVKVASVAAGAACQQRILMNSIESELIALDANTGEFCPDFGVQGRVDLKAGLGKGADAGQYSLTSAPTLGGTTVVVGGRVADNVSTDMPGGVMRGFDVITGEMRWAFDPGKPEDREAPAAGDTYTRSTPNVWAPMSYDPDSNTVFMPVGSAAIDLWGVKHTALDRKYGASMLALDATTGNEKWVYQVVHNDLWDFDVPMQPSFIDFTQPDGSKVPALVFGTKAGQLFVLDRLTGKPLTEVQERPVQPGQIEGERYSPTQPVSVGMPQIGADTLTESDMWGATPFDQLMCRIKFKSMRYDGLFTAPGTDPSLNLPGSLGGMNWGGLSVDPTRNYLFVNDMRVGLEVQLIPQPAKGSAPKNDGGEAANIANAAVPLEGTPYAINAKLRFTSPLDIPCQKPPFGTLTAVDLNTRQIAWQVPVGTVQDTGPLGIKMHLPIPVGMPTIGGTLSTQSGLLFIAATQDYYLRAYDSATGQEVWKGRLPVGSQGTPISYKDPATGKQYIVISAGGARNSPDRGDYVIAYALPD